MKYTVIIEKGRESGYVAQVPAPRGCASQGRTKKEVLTNIREAIEVYVEALKKDGLLVSTEWEGKHRGRDCRDVRRLPRSLSGNEVVRALERAGSTSSARKGATLF